MGQNATDAHVSPLTLPTGHLPAVRPFGLTFERRGETHGPATPARTAGRLVPPVTATVIPARRRGRHFAEPPVDAVAVGAAAVVTPEAAVGPSTAVGPSAEVAAEAMSAHDVLADGAHAGAAPADGPVLGQGNVVVRVELPDARWWARLVRAPVTPLDAEGASRYRVAVMYGSRGSDLVVRAVRAQMGEATVHLAEPDGSSDYHLTVAQVPGGVRVTRCSQVLVRRGSAAAHRRPRSGS